ncbi:metal ABC transporter solute-binding protein, Zn/Mn family [Aestuariimicrobium kwangyangense]|uniref:metal ABC transporter solute-binding protein, Zn/Mn family n=1 Tax=Aestuariimicrobium kwangyangense TaxID=396389 RepID=UPI0003B4B977|nr:zinc ABC transporter substrate-binding protein [Aestuariimicrobium kwangyangense]
MRRLIAVLTVALLALTAACSTDAKSSSGKPSVVASTSVWAAVARQVAGGHADVSAILDSPQQDPHDYEANAQDKLAFSRATVTVVNGGGYDDWATKLASSSSTVVNAVEVSGLPGAGEDGFNEHVWYSPTAAVQVATRVADGLAKADAANAAAYRQNLTAFTSTITALEARAQQIAAKNTGAGIVSTEPVGAHLFAWVGVKDVTPEAYVTGSESDAGPSVSAVNQTESLMTSGRVRALAVNPQTSDPVSDRLVASAKAAKVPTFDVYEILPDATMSYTDFLAAALTSLSKALSQ